MPKRLTVSKEKLLNSLVDGFTTSKASIYDKEQLFNLSRFIVTNNNFWFTFYIDAYFTLVLATKLLTRIIFPHIKEIIGEKEEK